MNQRDILLPGDRLTFAILVAVMFVGAAGACWMLANGFNVATPEGFDPLRYEYLARNGLPPGLADSASYYIVTLLSLLYEWMPPYVGYIVFAAALYAAVILMDRRGTTWVALLSPFAFYYIGQTGKDGLTILALIAVAIVASHRLDGYKILVALVVVALAVFVRPAVVLLIPVCWQLFRRGPASAAVMALLLSALFIALADGAAVVAVLEGIVSDEGSGALAQLLREYSFGYTLDAVLVRWTLYLASPLIQPLAAMVKIASGGDTFLYFEALCIVAFVAWLLATGNLVRFVVTSVPFVIILGTSSAFYHFRYAAVVYPVVALYCEWQRRRALHAKQAPILGAKRSRPPNHATNPFRST